MRMQISTWTMLFGLTLLVAGCDENSNLIGPGNQLEATNAVDQFQFQVTALQDVTDHRSYEWQNTGNQAKIDISEAITSGAAILTVRDATGSVLYQADIANDSDSTTTEGEPGLWRIEVALTNTMGTFNFRVQKVT